MWISQGHLKIRVLLVTTDRVCLCKAGSQLIEASTDDKCFMTDNWSNLYASNTDSHYYLI